MSLRHKVKALLPEHDHKVISGRRFAVLTAGNRAELYSWLSRKLGLEWDKSPDSKSSMGWIIDDETQERCCVKPSGRQGRMSSGMQNEDIFVSTLQEMMTKN